MKNINAEAIKLESLELVSGGSQINLKNLTIGTTGTGVSLPRYKVGQHVETARIGATSYEPGTIINIGRGYDILHNACWTYTIRFDDTSIPDETLPESFVSGESSVPYTPSSDSGSSSDHHLL